MFFGSQALFSDLGRFFFGKRTVPNQKNPHCYRNRSGVCRELCIFI